MKNPKSDPEDSLLISLIKPTVGLETAHFVKIWDSFVVVQLLSHVQLFATPWTVAHQAPPSMGFSRQEYWSALPFTSPRDLPDPVIKPTSPVWRVDSLPLNHLGSPLDMILLRNFNVHLSYYEQGRTLFSCFKTHWHFFCKLSIHIWPIFLYCFSLFLLSLKPFIC